MANGLDETGAAVERDARPYQDGIECRDGAEGVGAAVWRALGTDALDDVGERRVTSRFNGRHKVLGQHLCECLRQKPFKLVLPSFARRT